MYFFSVLISYCHFSSSPVSRSTPFFFKSVDSGKFLNSLVIQLWTYPIIHRFNTLKLNSLIFGIIVQSLKWVNFFTDCHYHGTTNQWIYTILFLLSSIPLLFKLNFLENLQSASKLNSSFKMWPWALSSHVNPGLRGFRIKDWKNCPLSFQLLFNNLIHF